jgi:hypothetical protein
MWSKGDECELHREPFVGWRKDLSFAETQKCDGNRLALTQLDGCKELAGPRGLL